MAFHPSPEASAWEWKEWVPEAPKRWAASPCKNHNTGAAKWFMLALSPCCFPAHSRRVFPLLSRTLEERLPPEFLALRLGDDDETDQEGCVGPGGAHRVVLHCGVGGWCVLAELTAGPSPPEASAQGDDAGIHLRSPAHSIPPPN